MKANLLSCCGGEGLIVSDCICSLKRSVLTPVFEVIKEKWLDAEGTDPLSPG
jgi:hypothetical protein